MEPNTGLSLTDVLVAVATIEPQRCHSTGTRDGATELGTMAGVEFGVWEMSEGTATDTEADEVFLVLSGSATIYFLDESRSLEICSGDLVRLGAGARTRWTVHEWLRKLYLTIPDSTIDESRSHD